MQVKEEKKPDLQVSVASVQETTQDKLARALAVCGEVARLYKRRGNPPKWVKRNPDYDETQEDSPKWIDDPQSGSTPYNHAWKRNIRSWAKRHSPVKHVPLLRCEQCGLWFVGRTMVRCQCKVVCKPRIEED